MGFFKNVVSSQFIDVIEWTDDTQNTMVRASAGNTRELTLEEAEGAHLTAIPSAAKVG